MSAEHDADGMSEAELDEIRGAVRRAARDIESGDLLACGSDYDRAALLREVDRLRARPRELAKRVLALLDSYCLRDGASPSRVRRVRELCQQAAQPGPRAAEVERCAFSYVRELERKHQLHVEGLRAFLAADGTETPLLAKERDFLLDLLHGVVGER